MSLITLMPMRFSYHEVSYHFWLDLVHDDLQGDNSSSMAGERVKIDRLAGILPYVSYEESKRLYTKVQHELSAVIDAVSSKGRCNQPAFCADDEQSFD